MPTRYYDAFNAYGTVYTTIASAGTNRNDTTLTEEALSQLFEALYHTHATIFPASMFEQPSVSFEIVYDEPEETEAEHSEALDNFLKEFALKEVC